MNITEVSSGEIRAKIKELEFDFGEISSDYQKTGLAHFPIPPDLSDGYYTIKVPSFPDDSQPQYIWLRRGQILCVIGETDSP